MQRTERAWEYVSPLTIHPRGETMHRSMFNDAGATTRALLSGSSLSLLHLPPPPPPVLRGRSYAQQKSTWKVLPRSIQMHIMKEKEEEPFWERLLKVRCLHLKNLRLHLRGQESEQGSTAVELWVTDLSTPSPAASPVPAADHNPVAMPC